MAPAPKDRKTNKQLHRERRLRVRSVRRDTPDMRKLSKAIIGLALAEAEREAQAQAAEGRPANSSVTPPPGKNGGRHGA